MAVRAQRQQLVSSDEPDLDREEARHLPSPEERLVSFGVDLITIEFESTDW